MIKRGLHPFWAWLVRGLFLALFVAVLWLQCSAKINLITADLGRHIHNGAIFSQSKEILSTNYYAYTHPGFPTICHHWGAGVIMFWVQQMGGFLALSVFYTAILVVTVLVFFAVAWRWAGFWNAMLMALLSLPLLAYRVEIRPEGFTTLFLGLELLILWSIRARWASVRWLWAIPVIQFVWINSHILFFTGFALMTFFIVEALLTDRQRGLWKTMIFVGVSAAGVSLLNPSGLSGFLEPLNIFREYGYQLVENQSLFFMLQRFPGQFVYPYLAGILSVSVVLLGVRFALERRWQAVVLDILVLIFFGLMSLKAVRAMAMFGLFFIPFVAFQLQQIIVLSPQTWGVWVSRLVKAAVMVLLGGAALNPGFFLSPLNSTRFLLSAEPAACRRSLLSTLAYPQVWAGLMPEVNGSAGFFKANGLKGPIFNNYDIGGYLIYHLFPQERPFVDNRPEAYPVEFFSKVYTPMQENDALWVAVDRQYGFQVIYFFRHDQTPWAQPFLLRRVDDPLWAPVFVDAYTIIFVKRGGINQPVVEKFELPRAMFHSTPTGR
ncbi:MAG: hypothetical protein V2A70_00375 [Candidatus Omnitrophota bacterium]